MRFKNATKMLAVLVSMALLAGCVDVPSNGPEPIEVNSEYRFVNADAALGPVTINFDLGPAVSGLEFGAANAYQVFPSGRRVGTLGNGEVINVAMTTDQRGTIVILPVTEGFRDFEKLVERRIFDATATPTAKLNLFHAAIADSVAGPDFNIAVTGADTSVTVSGVEYGKSSGYLSLPAGSYTIEVFAAGDSVAAVSSSVELGNMRNTSLIMGDATSGLSIVSLSDN